MDAEGAIKAHHYPVEQGWFVAIGLAVQNGYDPASGLEHLPRNLGIPGLLRFLKGIAKPHEQ
jgi:hypothetical protein